MQLLRGSDAIAALKKLWLRPFVCIELASSTELPVIAWAAPDCPVTLVDVIQTPQLGSLLKQAPVLVAYNAKKTLKILHQQWQLSACAWACTALCQQLLDGKTEATSVTRQQLAVCYQQPVLAAAATSFAQLADQAKAWVAIVGAQQQALRRHQLTAVQQLEAACIPILAAMETIGMPFVAKTFAAVVQDNKQEQQKLPSNHPRYQQLNALLHGWGQQFLRFVGQDQRIHSEFIQLGSKTGRIICRNPALQAMPMDPARRHCFAPHAGRCLVIGDYQACELRLVAGLSSDPQLLAACAADADIHLSIAKQLFGKALPEDGRKIAKVVSFGLMYGMGTPALAKVLQCSYHDAQHVIAAYQRVFPQVFAYLAANSEQAQLHGFTRTPLGRWLRYPGQSFDHKMKRLARNMPIQGSSSDMIKLALTRLFTRLQHLANSHVVHCIHDEIIVECPKALATTVSEHMQAAMLAAGKQIVPQVVMKVNVTQQTSWQK